MSSVQYYGDVMHTTQCGVQVLLQCPFPSAPGMQTAMHTRLTYFSHIRPRIPFATPTYQPHKPFGVQRYGKMVKDDETVIQ